MQFRIGVDGGGTKTELILVDSEGLVAARHTAPGCSPSHLGPEKARFLLAQALSDLRGNRIISHTHLYLAGSPEFWRETAAEFSGFGRIIAADDSLPVLELATNGAPGLVLHAGTGSFIAARAPDGSLHYAGGLGWKLGDPGSGFDLGRRGIAHALLELQGWTAATPLGQALQTHLALTEAGAIKQWLYREAAANAAIADFAPRVLELAAAGCAPAQAVLAASLHEFVAQARLVTDRLFPVPATPVPCGVSGAILNSPPAAAILRTLAATHAWPVACRFLTEPPIEGVRRLLMKA